MSRVSIRGGFSDRNGIKVENTQIQLTDFDKRTRVQLHNLINGVYREVYGDRNQYDDDLQDFFVYVIGEVYDEQVDAREAYCTDDVFTKFAHTFNCCSYDEILTLIEALIRYWDDYLKQYGFYYDRYTNSYESKSLFDKANEIFKKEYIGYRFVDRIIVKISDPVEVNAVVDALNCKLDIVYDHISKANKYLSDRNAPDYENSIKESISAVEALCTHITGAKGGEATLGSMLNKLTNNNKLIHPAMKSAFEKLYGYTSDANGIRHAGNIGGPGSTFEEAKFMLVTCCAFINYIVELNSH